MPDLNTSLNSLQKKLEEQKFLVAVLALWAHAKTTTGLTEDDIRAFTFRPDFLTKEEAKQNRKAHFANKPPVYCDKNWHNALRLHDDRLVSMPGIKRPTPPEDTPTNLQVRI